MLESGTRITKLLWPSLWQTHWETQRKHLMGGEMGEGGGGFMLAPSLGEGAHEATAAVENTARPAVDFVN